MSTQTVRLPLAPAGSALTETEAEPRCQVRVMDGRLPCPRPPRWDIVLECRRCRRIAGGLACDFHKEQAEDWDIPHYVASGEVCREGAALVIALPL